MKTNQKIKLNKAEPSSKGPPTATPREDKTLYMHGYPRSHIMVYADDLMNQMAIIAKTSHPCIKQ